MRAIEITLDTPERIEFTWAFGAKTGYSTPKGGVVLDTGGGPSETFRWKLVEAIQRYREEQAYENRRQNLIAHRNSRGGQQPEPKRPVPTIPEGPTGTGEGKPAR